LPQCSVFFELISVDGDPVGIALLLHAKSYGDDRFDQRLTVRMFVILAMFSKPKRDIKIFKHTYALNAEIVNQA